MSTPPNWHSLIGDWSGTNRLWLDPEKSARESETTASVTPAAQGRFLVFRYTWADEGKPQDGELLVSLDVKREALTAAWIDSWHMGDRFMAMTGEASENGGIVVQGSYEAPPGPDWGWRIEIHPQGDDGFELLMVNIWPEGREDRAVQAVYTRQR